MLRKLCLTLFLLGILASGVAAQDDASVVLDGLNNPRHMTFDASGALYVAEAGSGGDQTATSPLGETVTVGFTSQVTVLSADGERSIFISNLFSRTGFDGVLGANKVIVAEDAVWLAVGEGLPADENARLGLETWQSVLVQLDPATFDPVQVIDLFEYEFNVNPGGDELISSNPTDFVIADDGAIYIVDASANAMMKWTDADGLTTFASWEIVNFTSPVPTSVDIGPDGDLYVGFLGGFPFDRASGMSRVERWSQEGELVATYSGVNLVTDVMVTDDGTVYAVELADTLDAEGYIPNSGRIVIVSEDGVTPVVTGLNYPYSIAMDPDGNLLVTVNSAFMAPGSGQVIMVELEEAAAPPPAPTQAPPPPPPPTQAPPPPPPPPATTEEP